MGVVIVCFFVAAVRYLLGSHLGRAASLLPVLRSGDLLLARHLHRHLHRRADLYRLRRHLDALRRGPQSAPQHPAGHGADLSDHGRPGRRSRSTPRNWSGPISAAIPTWTPRSPTWPAAPAAPCCFRCERHAPGRHHRLGHGIATGRGAPALRHGPRQRHSPAASSEPSKPSTAFRATTCCSSGGLALAGAFLMSYQLGAELLNFGAFIGFMGVNVAAFLHYYVRERKRDLMHFAAARPGVSDLPLYLAQPAHARQDRGRHLAGRRDRLCRVQDRRVPAGDRVFRAPAE